MVHHVRSSVLLLLLVFVAACGGDGTGGATGDASPSPTAVETSPTAGGSPTEDALTGSIRLYTSVTQDTVDAVVAAFAEAYPDVDVEVFRAPTGELTARIAAEQREGRVRGDVLWLTDPLSTYEYAEQGLLRAWEPENAAHLNEAYREDTFWGTRILNVAVVQPADAEPIETWDDLSGVDGDVALPDPGFAGSAFGALAFFGLDERYGFDYYRALDESGLVQVQAPGDVLTGVAEGRFAAGMTLDKVARDAIADGAPVQLVAPQPGAVAVYSPIAVVGSSEATDVAEAFVDFVLSEPAQRAIADTGWQPVRDDVPWEHEDPQVTPDWATAFEQRDELLERYRAVVGG